MSGRYDAIVVGARCAGAPTAMLLARKGYRVLLVDKGTFPSDIMSTHLIHVPGTAALARWGVLEAVAATNCPAVDKYIFDFGEIVIVGQPRSVDGIGQAYAPRRTVLDTLLVQAAEAAGAELRMGFAVEEVLFDGDRVVGIRRGATTDHASIVVGADGLHSAVARAVRAPTYHDRGKLAATYYAYWSGVPTNGFEVFDRPYRSWGAIPTNDGLTCIFANWPMSEFAANRADIEGNHSKTLEMAPAFAERVRAGRRETRYVGTGEMSNFYRVPFGPGWALVGDAGYHKDPGTAQGISDAFRDAERLVHAIDRWSSGGAPYEAAMLTFQRARDEATLPMFDLTCQIASLEPPSSALEQIIGALPGNQSAIDDFASVIAGSLPVQAFFDEENIERIMRARVAAR
jgi:flavin-dependent dehydrogenase